MLEIDAAVLPRELGEHAQERFDDMRVERLARFLLEQRDRAFDRHRLVIRPLGGQRVEVVNDRQDARAERDVVFRAIPLDTAAVPSLVVTEDERRDGIRKRHPADDSCADLRMDAYLLKFFRG